MPALAALAQRHGLLLVEDAAQAHGAALGGRPVGSFGEVAAFSFYPTKNMTTGEGGMVVVDNQQTARRLRLLRNQGMEVRYQNEIVGFNARMTDIAAAIGRVQLRRLPEWNRRRRDNARELDGLLKSVQIPVVSKGAVHVYHQYTVRCTDREGLLRKLGERGVEAGVYYPVPIHRLPSFGLELDLPQTELAAREVLSLPVNPTLKRGDLLTVAQAVNA
jgi:dTDP-4-amino-4,6-dideoxygalactose transaminase